MESSGMRRTFLDPHPIWTERRRSNRLAFVLFWSILMYFFSTAYIVSVGIVTDISMQPTLAEGGTYLVNKYIYHFVPPEREDIVVFRRNADGSAEYVKRVVGLPGETVTIRHGQVYIDGRRLDESYAMGSTYPDFGPRLIGKGAYFVLGDNRQMSEDSRDFGAVPLESVRGKIKPGELFPLR